MISVNEAKEIIRKNISVLPSLTLPLTEAVGYVLADDVFSPIDFPPFHQSSVDGYAIYFTDAGERFIVSEQSSAGSEKKFSLPPKSAMRIFTGAPVPANADTVVMQEKTVINNRKLMIQDEELQPGSNFRPQGKDIKKNSIALKKNVFLSAGAVGFLAGLGITEVSVVKKPSISIIVMGNELQQPGNPLEMGQVYESNSFALKAALSQLHFTDVKVACVSDNLQQLTDALNHSIEANDMVILCGGISVGDYDFVLQAATNCGVETLFHKVKQSPGKPLYFGRKKNKIVFGLPGNPSSALTCFYEYVVLALNLMMNQKTSLQSIKLKLSNAYKKNLGLSFFLKGWCENDKITILNAQESYRLSSFAKANCLVYLEEQAHEYKAGDMVEVHILPN